jgi:hypothetical protein
VRWREPYRSRESGRRAFAFRTRRFYPVHPECRTGHVAHVKRHPPTAQLELNAAFFLLQQRQLAVIVGAHKATVIELPATGYASRIHPK